MKWKYGWWNRQDITRSQTNAIGVGQIGVYRYLTVYGAKPTEYLGDDNMWGTGTIKSFRSLREALGVLYRTEGKRVVCINHDTKRARADSYKLP